MRKNAITVLVLLMALLLGALGIIQNYYFVFVMTGTDDFAYTYDKNRTDLMRTSVYSIDVEDNVVGNFLYCFKKVYSPGRNAEIKYTYNGKKVLWSGKKNSQDKGVRSVLGNDQSYKAFTADTRIEDVIKDPAFGNFGRLLFPTDKRYYSGDTLGKLSLTWYSNINPNKTVEIVNYLKERTESGDTIFYEIYSDKEKVQDPTKEDTGLFFFAAIKAQKQQLSMQAEDLYMSEQCMTVFPMLLNSAKRGITHLL